MLQHEHASPRSPQRTVVIGAAGFVGAAVMRRLAAANAAAVGVSRANVDLLAPDAATALAGLLRDGDAVVAVAAMAPVRNIDMLVDNMRLTRTILAALRGVKPSHVVNISSDAIYADAPLPLTENSTAAPTSLHGAMHLAREIAFGTEIKCPFATLRPTLIYGASDPHNGYGPNRFRRLAHDGQDIVLFGEGEERRDHVHVDDVAELVWRTLAQRSAGTLNVASGTVHSFRSVAQQVVAIARNKVAIRTSPRVGPMPHGGYRPFDVAATRAVFPDFDYRSLQSGLAKAQADMMEQL